MTFLFNPCQPCCVPRIDFCQCSGMPSILCLSYTESSGIFVNATNGDSFSPSKLVGAASNLVYNTSEDLYNCSGVGFNQCGINSPLKYLDFNHLTAYFSCVGDNFDLYFSAGDYSLEQENHFNCNPFSATGIIYPFAFQESGYIKYSIQGSCRHNDFCGLPTSQNLNVYDINQEQVASLSYNNQSKYYEGDTPSGFLMVKCVWKDGGICVGAIIENCYVNQFQYSLDSGVTFNNIKYIYANIPGVGFTVDYGADSVNYFGNYLYRDNYELVTALYSGVYFDEPTLILSNLDSSVIEPNKRFAPFCKKSFPKTLFANVSFNGFRGSFSDSIELNHGRLPNGIGNSVAGYCFVGWSGFCSFFDSFRGTDSFFNVYFFRDSLNSSSGCYNATLFGNISDVPLCPNSLNTLDGNIFCGYGGVSLSEGETLIIGNSTSEFNSCSPLIFYIAESGHNTSACSGLLNITLTQ